MKIHFDKLYKDDRIDELCGLGIPFPKGEITDSVYAKMQILDGDKKIPTQSKVTSRWEVPILMTAIKLTNFLKIS